ncbi:MAG: hypothetical protein IJA78_01455 [Clostridia bacterium]|nr:hypothetical protein [Clostridia bacterium]
MSEEQNTKKRTPVRKPRARAAAKSPAVPARNTAPQKLKLLITIVNREKAEFYTDLLQTFSVNLQFSISARGTATSELLQLMGLEENGKKVIFSLIREDRAPAALRLLGEKFATVRNGKGIAYTVPLSGMIGVALYRFLCDNRKAMKEE